MKVRSDATEITFLCDILVFYPASSTFSTWKKLVGDQEQFVGCVKARARTYEHGKDKRQIRNVTKNNVFTGPFVFLSTRTSLPDMEFIPVVSLATFVACQVLNCAVSVT